MRGPSRNFRRRCFDQRFGISRKLVVLINTVFLLISISRRKLINYERSPRILRASWMSLGMIVTRLAWIAARLVSSKRPTR